MVKRYDHAHIEKKWQKHWRKERVYEPTLSPPKSSAGDRVKPFYNLMMFPYPSAEGLHVGNMYAFTGADIYGRMKRMQGYDVFEPIGLDGFGIHSENYALKVGTHPMDQAEESEKKFYQQLESIGNGFAWQEHLETYDPEYYRWTQWIFIQLWKRGLTYRKKQSVNWCPDCKTVLADEQVVGGACERCSSVVKKRELEQWFFRITEYAERLLQNLDHIDWSERVTTAQRNWIGKSEGAIIQFEIAESVAPSYVLLHGYEGSPHTNFFPWLKRELEARGARVYVPALPNPNDPRANEQVQVALQEIPYDENTVIVGHSFGCVVAMKVIEQLKQSVRRTVLVAGFHENKFLDENFKPHAFDWQFDWNAIRARAGEVRVLRDLNDPTVPQENTLKLSQFLRTATTDFVAEEEHVCGAYEPEVLRACIDSIPVFTTRADTVFGATFLVLSPECAKQRCDAGWKANEEVAQYIREALVRRATDRVHTEKEKTGVFSGLYAINPAHKEKIPVWISDYVLPGYGTGAIMAVPAHDERDADFAKKYHLPISEAPLVSIDEGIEKSAGKKETQYRLRDWLISRQRYWGPPIPMVYCEACATAGKGEQETMPGWYAVPEEQLPVVLPRIAAFRPTGTGVSPLGTVREFYETHCPCCGAPAKRETDVSDTFLDSAWYYLRYSSVGSASANTAPWDTVITERWLPVDLYTGGAEHSVLHLLYVRFISLALHDAGLLRFGASSAPAGEPFPKFRAHGLLIKDGAKMSKSKGNVINPDAYVARFGADALRLYLMFLAPFEQGGDFRDAGMLGAVRFIERVWNYVAMNRDVLKSGASIEERAVATVERAVHTAIKKVSNDIESLHYNTAVSALMILLNEFEQHPYVPPAHIETFLKLLAPFVPHITEELWHELGNKDSIHIAPWPVFDPTVLIEATVTYAVQINGKMRGTVTVSLDTTEEGVITEIKTNEKIAQFLEGKTISKTVFVPKKIVNFIAQ